MSRRQIATLAPLLLIAACGRGQVSGLDPSDPLGGLDGGAIIPRDTGFDAGRPDGNDPLDADLPDGPGRPDRPDRPDGSSPDVPTVPDANVECRSEFDCWDQFGPPPCPQGGWTCQLDPSGVGFCQVECPPPPQCFNDCDCPFELSCARGECQPLNRRNLCCEAPFCPAGESCVLPGGGRSSCPVEPPPPDAGVPDVGPPDSGTPVSIGSPCGGPGSCAPGFCIDEQNGFPGGYCTEPCGGNGSCPTGSECQDFGQGQELCLDSCQTAADCRPGYACTSLGFSSGRVCWPEVPTSGNPNGAPVGDACNFTEDCNQGLSCFEDWPGGYCTRFYCDPVTSPCPGSSQCFAFPGSFSLCLDGCASGGSQSNCRPGYYCLGPTGQPGVCISN